jgi:hypothetical protein
MFELPVKCPSCHQYSEANLYKLVENFIVTCEQCGSNFDFVKEQLVADGYKPPGEPEHGK